MAITGIIGSAVGAIAGGKGGGGKGKGGGGGGPLEMVSSIINKIKGAVTGS